MSEFLTDVDIANRALQHVGSQMIDNTIGFAENSIRAQQTSFAYGKLRRAELRRNSWRFATRKAALRPIDSNTLMLAPSLWVSTTTYFKGSIVADENNNLWSSLIPNNTGNHPLTSSMWEAYFGPMTVQLYDSTQQYYSGELTYTAAGDGTYNTFRSLASVNAVHPALPNQWSTIGVYSKNQVVQQFPAWSSLTTYTQGQSVSFTDGNIYSSLTNGNTNNNPASSAANWSHMPVLTLTAQPVSSAAMVTGPQSSPIVEWSQVSTYQLGVFRDVQFQCLFIYLCQ